MKYIFLTILLMFMLSCSRTYHLYVWDCNDTKVEVKVEAIVEHRTAVDTDATVPPLGGP